MDDYDCLICHVTYDANDLYLVCYTCTTWGTIEDYNSLTKMICHVTYGANRIFVVFT
jgi:lipopolysaccharide biosynthesis regulator YciM